MAQTYLTVLARRKRAKRIRATLHGTANRPRLSVFRSNKHIYGQIVDDVKGITLVSYSTQSKGFDGSMSKNKCDQAKQVGLLLAGKAKALGIERIVFDRGGNLYHGRIKSLSEGAREGGLLF